MICGYIAKAEGVNSLILGQYQKGKLKNQGHVTLGVSTAAMEKIAAVPRASAPLPPRPSDRDARWVEPRLVCTVKYMDRQESGALRQPVFKALRDDKKPKECLAPEEKE